MGNQKRRANKERLISMLSTWREVSPGTIQQLIQRLGGLRKYKCHSKSAAGLPEAKSTQLIRLMFTVETLTDKRNESKRMIRNTERPEETESYLLEVGIFFRWQQFEFFPFFL